MQIYQVWTDMKRNDNVQTHRKAAGTMCQDQRHLNIPHKVYFLCIKCSDFFHFTCYCSDLHLLCQHWLLFYMTNHHAWAETSGRPSSPVNRCNWSYPATERRCPSGFSNTSCFSTFNVMRVKVWRVRSEVKYLGVLGSVSWQWVTRKKTWHLNLIRNQFKLLKDKFVLCTHIYSYNRSVYV